MPTCARIENCLYDSVHCPKIQQQMYTILLHITENFETPRWKQQGIRMCKDFLKHILMSQEQKQAWTNDTAFNLLYLSLLYIGGKQKHNGKNV